MIFHLKSHVLQTLEIHPKEFLLQAISKFLYRQPMNRIQLRIYVFTVAYSYGHIFDAHADAPSPLPFP